MKIAFKSFGCKLNQYEIQALREGFEKFGYTEVSATEPADYYVLNTCTVTAGADADARAVIRHFHRLNAEAKIIVTGCYAEADAGALEAMPGVYKVLGNLQKNQILHVVTGFEDAREEESPFFKNGISAFDGYDKAFVKVQDGCNYFCSFCKIPYVRGRLVSRPKKQILEEVQRLIQSGYKEIILSGVCLGSYGRDLETSSVSVRRDASLADHHAADKGNRLIGLLKEILALPGDWRLRLSSIDPRDTPLEIVRLMRSNPKLCRHLHLSLQSGSEVILNLMHRGYSAREYLQLVREMRNILPEIGLTTDVIVGFPGEDDVLFQETLAFLDQINFHHIHFFPYSERSQTKAAELPARLERGVIKERLRIAQSRYHAQQQKLFQTFLGQSFSVLVESKELDGGTKTGFTDHYLRCLFPGDKVHAGELITVQAESLQNNNILCSLTS